MKNEDDVDSYIEARARAKEAVKKQKHIFKAHKTKTLKLSMEQIEERIETVELWLETRVLGCPDEFLERVGARASKIVKACARKRAQ